LFILFTGEEKGLLGSAFYAEDPIIAFENTMVNINLDMMGRVDKKHEDQADYIYVIGADRLSTDLHKINESVNNAYEQLVLDYTFNAEDDPNRYYYRSDHYNFASNGVPSIFFFNGTHDDYHRPGDTVDKINLSALEKRGRHVFHLVWELANRDKAIEVDVN
jgi:Zn-dependent M28 family amino/carboxypeptidase